MKSKSKCYVWETLCLSSALWSLTPYFIAYDKYSDFMNEWICMYLGSMNYNASYKIIILHCVFVSKFCKKKN